MIRDHHRGSNIYNLNTREKIAYATSIPFRYVTLSAAVAAPAATEINAFLGKLANPSRDVVGLRTHATVDGNETYGYELTLKNVPYTGFDPLDGIFGEEPETLRLLREAGITIVIHSIYFLVDGTPKYFGVKMRTKEMPIVEELVNLENFENIRQAVISKTEKFHAKYWFDLTNHDNMSLAVIDEMPTQLTDRDVYTKSTLETYTTLKQEYYQHLVDREAISQDDYNYIIESSPRMQQSMVKWLWSGNSLIARELESVCVHDFEDV